MNTVANAFMFVLSSVLPLVVLALAFFSTLWCLGLFWASNIDHLNDFSGQKKNHCARLFYTVLFIDILYFFLAGWCLYAIGGRWFGAISSPVFAIIGICLGSYFFNRLEKNMIID